MHGPQSPHAASPLSQHPASYGPPYGTSHAPVVCMQQTTIVVKAPFRHGIHVVLDVLTCGIWLPVHLLCWAAR
jgi:hypothetical protein